LTALKAKTRRDGSSTTWKCWRSSRRQDRIKPVELSGDPYNRAQSITGAPMPSVDSQGAARMTGGHPAARQFRPKNAVDEILDSRTDGRIHRGPDADIGSLVGSAHPRAGRFPST